MLSSLLKPGASCLQVGLTVKFRFNLLKHAQAGARRRRRDAGFRIEFAQWDLRTLVAILGSQVESRDSSPGDQILLRSRTDQRWQPERCEHTVGEWVCGGGGLRIPRWLHSGTRRGQACGSRSHPRGCIRLHHGSVEVVPLLNAALDGLNIAMIAVPVQARPLGGSAHGVRQASQQISLK